MSSFTNNIYQTVGEYRIQTFFWEGMSTKLFYKNEFIGYITTSKEANDMMNRHKSTQNKVK